MKLENSSCGYNAGSDACHTWQDLQTITVYKWKPGHQLPSDPSLSDKLKSFYARFVASSTEPCKRAAVVPDASVILLSVANVSKTFK
jgi:hypothetical protein